MSAALGSLLFPSPTGRGQREAQGEDQGEVVRLAPPGPSPQPLSRGEMG